MEMSVADGPTTGAHLRPGGDAPATNVARVPVRALDHLFADSLSTQDRALLKLDLQGYELAALKGGERILSSVEVILMEVSFFAQSYEPSIAELIAFLDERAFELFDIASVTGRRRDNRARQGDFIFVRRDSGLLKDKRWA